MLPNPLHPAVVHFPIVLAILLPLVVLGAIWAIRRGSRPGRAWAIPLAVAALLAVSAFVSLRTGQAEEERVETVVTETALHEHEEAAERFLVLSGVLLLVAVVGLGRGVVGTSARLVTAAGSVLLLAAGVQVGAAGGELVYRHNAGSVYAQNAGTVPAPAGEIENDD